LEHEADPLAPELGQLPLVQPGERLVVDGDRAEVGWSRPAAQCRKVLLPDPDGPITAVKEPRAKPMLTLSSATTELPPRP